MSLSPNRSSAVPVHVIMIFTISFAFYLKGMQMKCILARQGLGKLFLALYFVVSKGEQFLPCEPPEYGTLPMRGQGTGKPNIQQYRKEMLFFLTNVNIAVAGNL